MELSVQHTGNSDKMNVCHCSSCELGLFSLTREKQDSLTEKSVLWSVSRLQWIRQSVLNEGRVSIDKHDLEVKISLAGYA